MTVADDSLLEKRVGFATQCHSLIVSHTQDIFGPFLPVIRVENVI